MRQVPSSKEMTLLTKKERVYEKPLSCIKLLPHLEEVFGNQPAEILTSLHAHLQGLKRMGSEVEAKAYRADRDCQDRYPLEVWRVSPHLHCPRAI